MVIITGKFFVLGLLLCTTVCAETVHVSQRASTKPYYAFELSLSKQDVFLEERVPFKIRLVFDQNAYSINNIMSPNMAHIQLDPLSPAKKGHQMIDGKNCFVYEWDGVLYPKKVGTIALEPFQVSGEQRTSATRGMWNMFTSNSVVFTSNGCVVRVQALPGQLQGGKPVGDFYEVHLDAERTKLCAGEAITVRYHVQGSGNFGLFKHPELHVPEGLKSYAAQAKKESGGYCFEYAVQAVQDGIFVIPSQLFNYFDPETGSYKTRSTESVRLYVDPAKIAPAPEPVVVNNVNEVAEPDDEEELYSVEPGSSLVRKLALPNALFFMLLIMGMIGCVFCRARGIFQPLYSAALQWYKRRKMVRNVHTTIIAAKKVGDVKLMYQAFQELQSVVDWNNIKKDGARYGAWQLFWERLEIARFDTDVDHISDELVVEARQWITYFEQKA